MAHEFSSYGFERHIVPTMIEGVLADIILFTSIIALTALMSLTGD
ncbi:hypothetical protein FHT78_005830 [Rhizobium sp. BK196]|nr:MULTISPECIES: hypothetical protein [unclassified Rhizobium]MBB3314023.1 hypothetical protein [Rhizobium sp. BK196]MBB3464243.1 hypothetical protein [Rhizobium sp. BK377]